MNIVLIIILKSNTKLNIQIRNYMNENTQLCTRDAENSQSLTTKIQCTSKPQTIMSILIDQMFYAKCIHNLNCINVKTINNLIGMTLNTKSPDFWLDFQKSMH